MILEPNCGYFNEERDDEYAPPYGMCEECYRYNICKKAKELEHIEEWMNLNNVYIISSIDGNGNHVGRLRGLYLDANDDLIIDIDIDDLSCTTEETLGCTDRDCSYCKNGTYRKPIHQLDGTLIRRVNFCDNCGRDLRHL